MFYRVLFFDKSKTVRYGTGVYAENEKSARDLAAIILSLSHNITVNPEILVVVEIKNLTSDIPTTT